jgi:DNA-3-methyladenine glycosylase
VPGSPDLADLLEAPSPSSAPLLLGAVLRHTTAEGTVAVRLTEVEAYAGERDPGSHAFRGRTARNGVMFGPPGRLYVYLSYGLHHCCNVVVGPEGEASAVLLRAGEIVEGVELARSRRRAAARDRELARGPGRLCGALGVASAHNGVDLRRGPLTLTVADHTDHAAAQVRTGPRVGLRLAADVPWRFWLEGEPTVSAYKRSPRAERAPGGPAA